MHAFVTGASGFVGGWLRAHLEASGDTVSELVDGLDVTDRGALSGSLVESEPDVVYHLAALTHVGESWSAPQETMRVNVGGTLEVLEAAGRCARPPRVILVSSAEVYGGVHDRLIDEATPLRPVTPYAASKVASEFYGLQAFLGRGLEVVIARPFNHVGPGQSPSFVVSGLARRVVQAERTGSGEIAVGNLTAVRDFTDVRDVVRAYRLLAALGVPGEVYNVASGVGVPIATVLDELLARATTKIVAIEDPSLLRPVDVPEFVGSSEKLTALTGWTPTIPLGVTLGDALDAQRAAP